MKVIFLAILCIVLPHNLVFCSRDGNQLGNVPGPVDLNVVHLVANSTHSISVTWKAPSIGGENINKYDVIFCEVNGMDCNNVETNETFTILPDLKAYRQYYVTVVAYNGVVKGEPSNIVRFRSPTGVPAAPPRNVTLRHIKSTSISVSWDQPSVELQNGIIEGYVVQYKKGRKIHSLQTTDERIKIHGLVAGEIWRVRVSARTSAGIGKFSRWKKLNKPKIKRRKPCRAGWITGGDKCYFFSRDKCNWFVARAACTFVIKGKLVTIESAKENKAIKKLARQSGRGNFWIGVSDVQKNEHYTYVTAYDDSQSENVTFSDWSHGSANPSVDHNWVQLKKKNGFRWHMTKCSNSNYFICEESLTMALSYTAFS